MNIIIWLAKGAFAPPRPLLKSATVMYSITTITISITGSITTLPIDGNYIQMCSQHYTAAVAWRSRIILMTLLQVSAASQTPAQ